MPFAALAFAFLLTVGVPHASALSFSLDTPNSAGSGFTGPYATVTVSFVNSSTANVTFTSLTNGGYTYLMGDGSTVALSVNASTFTVDSISGTHLAGFCSLCSYTVENPPGSSNVNGFGSYNLVIDTSDGFTDSSNSVSFTLHNPSATWSSDLNVLTPNDTTHNSLAESHIFACDINPIPCTTASGAAATFFVAGSGNPTLPPTEVPEPSTLLLLGSGMVALAKFARSRRLD